MAIELPSLDTLRHILDRLKANDISWFKDQFAQGKFAWLKDRLPAGEFEKIESRVQAGDLSSLKGALSSVDLPGMDLFKGLGGVAAGVGAAGVGAAAMAGKGLGGVKGAAATGVVDGGAKKKPAAWLWAIPIIAAIALLAFFLRGCGSSSPAADVVDTSVDTVVDTAVVDTAVVDSTVAGAGVDTTPATSVAETSAPDTKAAETTAAATTEAATTVAEAATTAAADTTIAAAGTTVAAAGAGDIVSVASAAGSFNTLTAALGAAGLTDTLKGAGPFTVFAPTDDAFKALPAGAVDALLKPENKDLLTKILTYHVVSAKVVAADVKPGDVKTLEGEDFKVSIDGDKVKVNDANVTKTDIMTSNGVIHVLDKVLIPASANAELTKLLAGGAAAPTTVADAAAAPATATPENLTIYFGNASSAIVAAEQTKIDGAIEKLKALPAGSKVAIVGHASATGNAAANKALSIKRADAVKAKLVAGLGDKGSNITFTVDAKGDSDPAGDEAKSRRVTIEIQP
jgi:uncharacterized surface protein with fasciclin (FAS1) repeats